MTTAALADWLLEYNILDLMFRGFVHKSQYVAKLEEPIKFMINEKRLTLDHLSAIWRCQLGKHETIVNNIYDLLAKLAWHFETEQLDQLFLLFKQVRQPDDTKHK